MARSNEPMWWSLFSAGGVIAAFLMPATIVITAITVPAGWISAEQFHHLAAHPLSRLYLLVLIALPLFHWAHRFRYAVADLGIKLPSPILAVLCYGAAILGALLAVFFLTS